MTHYTDEPTISVEFYIPHHGAYSTMITDFDRAMAYFANATTNDLMWNMLDHSGYEIDYSDVSSRFGLLVMWCDTHGLSVRGESQSWRDDLWTRYTDAPTQEAWERNTRHIQDWHANNWANGEFWTSEHNRQPESYSCVKQDQLGHVYRECCNQRIPFEHSHTWSDGSTSWPPSECMMAHCDECGHMTYLSTDRISGYSTSRQNETGGPPNTAFCRHCDQIITSDAMGTWVDESGGDVCGWDGGNEPHEPDTSK